MDCTKPYWLVMNGHSSHIIVNVIAFCMHNSINLFMLLLHCLQLFQLFNVDVLMLLICVLNKEIDSLSQ